MEPNGEFIWLCLGNKIDEARDIMKHPEFDVNVVITYRQFQMEIVLTGKSEVVKMLFLHEDLDRRNLIYTQDLQIACLVGDEEKVKELLEVPGGVDHRKLKDFSPLHLASAMGYAGIVEMLLKQEWIDVNQELWFKNTETNENCNYGTAFYSACTNENLAVIEVLVRDKRVDIHSMKNLFNQSGFHELCKGGRCDIIEFLLENTDIDVNCPTNGYGYTPLMFSVMLRNDSEVFMTLIKWAKKRGSNLNSRNFLGDTVFTSACLNCTAAVKYMLEECEGVDYNNETDSGLSGFSKACNRALMYPYEDRKEILEMLVKDKRISYPDTNLNETNTEIWDLLLLGVAIDPSRMCKVSYSDHFKQERKELGFLFECDPQKVERLRIYCGLAHEMAGSLWVFLRMVDERMMRVSSDEGEVKRFFDLCLLLPLELQMLIPNRVYGVSDSVIEKKQIQKQLEHCNEFFQ